MPSRKMRMYKKRSASVRKTKSMNGGKRRFKNKKNKTMKKMRKSQRQSRFYRKRTQRGGGLMQSLIPQDLLSAFENVSYNANSAASNLMGSVNHPQNPAPTKGHAIDMNYKVIPAGVVNIPAISEQVSADILKIQ